MNEQHTLGRARADAADQEEPGNPIASGPSLQQIQVLLGRDISVIVPTPDTVGDSEEMGMPVGDGARFIHDIQPAARIVATMMNDARLLFEKELTRSVR